MEPASRSPAFYLGNLAGGLGARQSCSEICRPRRAPAPVLVAASTAKGVVWTRSSYSGDRVVHPAVFCDGAVIGFLAIPALSCDGRISAQIVVSDGMMPLDPVTSEVRVSNTCNRQRRTPQTDCGPGIDDDEIML